MPNLTKQQVPCAHCRSIMPWHQLTDGRYRCLECFSTIDAPKPVKSKAEAAPQPAKPTPSDPADRSTTRTTGTADPAAVAVRSAKRASPPPATPKPVAVKDGKDWASEGPALDRNRKR